MSKELVWQRLRSEGVIDDAGLRAAGERIASTGEDLASACWILKLAPERDLVRVVCQIQGYPGIDLSRSVIRLANLDLLPDDVVRTKLVLPVSVSEHEIVVAMADPDDLAIYDELRFLTGRKVLRHVAIPAALQAAIGACFKGREAGEAEWRGREAWMLEPPPEGKAAVVHPSAQPPPGSSPFDGLPLVLGQELAAGPETLRGWLDPFLETTEMPPRVAPPPTPAPASAPGDSPAAPRADPGITLKVFEVGAGKTVLVVDDDPEMRELEKKLLAPFGCAVVETGDGKQALSLARELVPDVVLLDAMLPGMHGFEVCRAIKGDAALRHAGIVMISGIYTGWRIGADLKEVYGADYFFEKPFRVGEVSRAVRVLLVGGSGAEALSRARREEALATVREALAQARAGKLTKAVGLLQAAVQKDPFSAEPQYFLGQVLRQAGQPYQAVAALERAVDLRPDLDQPLAVLGELYLALGFRKTARDVFARALDVCRDEGRCGRLRARLAALGK